MIKLINRSSISLLILIIVLSTVFITYREIQFNKNAQKSLSEQADNIAISLWQFDKEVCNSNINFFSKLNSYQTLEVIDYTGATFTSSDTLHLSHLDKLLFKANLIRILPFSADIIYIEKDEVEGMVKRKRIGTLNAKKYNLEIYNYFYVVLVLILLFLIYVAFSNIYQTNTNLEKLINEKTKRLRQSEEKLLITLNSICDGVLATDTKGTIVNMNPVAEKILGISLKKGRGKPAKELVHIYEMDSNRPIVQGGDNLISNKIEMVGKITRESEDKFLSVTLSPIKDIQNNNVGIVYVIRDITEELKANEQARHSQKMESIGQLAGGIAHDFNNMLGGILGAAELLEIEFDEKSDPDVIENIELIKSSANLAADLTNQLLQFSRKNGANSSEQSIDELLKSTILLLQRSIDKKIELHLNSNEERELYIMCDKAQLQNAFLNLGVNARDALNDKGKIEYSVTLEKVANGQIPDLHAGTYVKVAVTDNGSGMSKEIQTKIFEPFFTTKDQGKGTGLGLAAVYSTIKDHHGTVAVESTLGFGTTFTVYIPLLREKRVTPAAIQPHHHERPTNGKTKSILLVDDETLIRTIEFKMLSKMGYHIIEATDGVEAVDIYREKESQIDIVLMDLIMPKLNGTDAYLQMKEINNDIRVIIMSGNINETKISELKSIGIEEFIRKPFQWQDISALLQ